MATIRPFNAAGIRANLPGLATLMHDCVHGGASIGYILPFTMADAGRFWIDKVLPGVDRDGVVMLVAETDGRIAGSVQLDHDTPPNQPHRAEVRKLLVHPDFRRRGIARALMGEIEARAKALKRSLLTLDTRTGDSAEPLYASLGFAVAGIIPGWCLDPFEHKFDSTTFMYKAI